MRYDAFIAYLAEEIDAGSQLADTALIECLIKYRELVVGPRIWSPRTRAYVRFDPEVHSAFARSTPPAPRGGGSAHVRFFGGLLPAYCRMCFLCDCHALAQAKARDLLERLNLMARGHWSDALRFEIRILESLTENLSSAPPAEVGHVCQSSDVSGEVKIATELLWCHLALTYAGRRRLLLHNVEQFMRRPQRSAELCSRELRVALFRHGKHEPFSDRKARGRSGDASGRSVRDPWRLCPVSVPSRRDGAARVEKLYESRVSRLCWLSALWVLGQHPRCKLGWLSNPESYVA